MIQVNSTTADILEGKADFSVWDDEELLRGQRRCQTGRYKGTFVGTRPRVVPLEVHHELNKRRMSRAGEVLRESLVGAVELWRSVLMDEAAPLGYRMEASKLIVDRVMGKAKETVDLRVTDEPPWAAAIRDMYRGGETRLVENEQQARELDVIDAEVVEDDFTEDPEDDPVFE